MQRVIVIAAAVAATLLPLGWLLSPPVDPTTLGFVGVSLLLLAFFLNLFRLIRAEASGYIALNLVGAGLACYSSYLIDFMPFVLLEGCWAIVAAAALLRLGARRRRAAALAMRAGKRPGRPGRGSRKIPGADATFAVD